MTERVTGAFLTSTPCSKNLIRPHKGRPAHPVHGAGAVVLFLALASLADGGCQLAGELANDGLQLVLLHVTGAVGTWWTRAHRQMSCLLPPSARSTPYLSGVWAL